MNALLKKLNSKIANIAQAAVYIASFSLVAQLFGFLRDRLLVSGVGIGRELDIYYASFRVPDFLFIVFSTLLSSVVLMPFLNKKMNESREAGEGFLSEVLSAFAILYGAIFVAVFLLMPWIVSIILPGFSAEEASKTVLASRIMLLSPLFMGLSNLFSTVNQNYKKFILYSLSPIFYNLGIIVGVLVFYDFLGVAGLAAGVVLGALLHFLIQFVPARLSGTKLRFTRSVNWKKIGGIFAVSSFRMFAMMTATIVMLFFNYYASFMKDGTISRLQFGYILQSVPIALVGVSYSVASFASMVDLFTRNMMREFYDTFYKISQHIIFWSLPIAVLFIVLRAHIVRVILGAGNFSWADVRVVAGILAVFLVGLVFYNLNSLIVRAYYAMGNTRTPFIGAVIWGSVAIGGVYFFRWLLLSNRGLASALADILRINFDDIMIVIFPMAFLLGVVVNFVFLWSSFGAKLHNGKRMKMLKNFGEVIFASLSAGATSYLLLRLLDGVFSLSSFSGVLGQGFFAGIGGIAVFCFVMYLVGNEVFLTVVSAVFTKLRISPKKIYLPEKNVN